MARKPYKQFFYGKNIPKTTIRQKTYGMDFDDISGYI